MADPSPGRGGVEWLADEFAKLRARLDSLESPSGTQLYNTVSKLQALVEDIQQTLTDFIQNDVNAIVDQRIAIALASYMSGNVSIGGGLVVNNGVTIGGPVVMPNVYNTNITAGGGQRTTVWVRQDGRVGHT